MNAEYMPPEARDRIAELEAENFRLREFVNHFHDAAMRSGLTATMVAAKFPELPSLCGRARALLGEKEGE